MADRQDEDRERIERELLERMQDQLLEVPVKDYLAGMLQSLPSIAFMRMGLTEETKGKRDLDQARLAIDSFRALLDVLGSTMPTDEAGMYRSTLAQMQMAYVGAMEQKPQETGEKPDQTEAEEVGGGED